MTIMFMTKFKDGSYTNFEEKIRLSLLLDGGGYFSPKKHTIRRSGRVKPGQKLSMRQWAGLPYRSKQVEFAKGECTGVQKIHIWHDSFGGRYVVIDDRDELLPDEKIKELAINDGFDTIDQFFSWFGWDFTGYIIHWTDLKY